MSCSRVAWVLIAAIGVAEISVAGWYFTTVKDTEKEERSAPDSSAAEQEREPSEEKPAEDATEKGWKAGDVRWKLALRGLREGMEGMYENARNEADDLAQENERIARRVAWLDSKLKEAEKDRKRVWDEYEKEGASAKEHGEVPQESGDRPTWPEEYRKLQGKFEEYERTIAKLQEARRALEWPRVRVRSRDAEGEQITGWVSSVSKEKPEVGWIFSLTRGGEVKALAQVEEVGAGGELKLRVIRRAPGEAPPTLGEELRLLVR